MFFRATDSKNFTLSKGSSRESSPLLDALPSVCSMQESSSQVHMRLIVIFLYQGLLYKKCKRFEKDILEMFCASWRKWQNVQNLRVLPTHLCLRPFALNQLKWFLSRTRWAVKFSNTYTIVPSGINWQLAKLLKRFWASYIRKKIFRVYCLILTINF